MSNVMYVRLYNASRKTDMYFKFATGFYVKDGIAPPNSEATTVEFHCYESTSDPSIPITGSSPTTTLPFMIRSISPGAGILAGGTRITIMGQHFIPCFVLMSFLEYVANISEPCSPTNSFVTTPPGGAADIGNQLRISLTFNSQDPIATYFTFTYRPNPRVNSIHPLKTLVVGGTTRIVEGKGFETLTEPRLIVRLTHMITDPLNDRQTDTTFTSLCEINASGILKCPTPKINIPDHFMHNSEQLTAVNDQESNAYTWNIDGESLEFYLGIKLDGDHTYEDLSVSLPQYSQIRVYILEPEFNRFTETREVSSNEHLQLTEKRLTNGLDITDYAVRIGTRACTVVELTVNELICVTPEDEDQEKEDELSVLVHPGTNLSPQLTGNLL